MTGLNHLSRFERSHSHSNIVFKFMATARFTMSMDTSVFQYCSKRVAEGIYTEVLECVSDQLEERAATQAATQAADLLSWLLVLAGALVFFMQAGFAMLCGGCVRKKNLQNTMLKNLLDACGATISFYCVGYAFAFGGQNDRTDITFVGVTNFFGTGEVDQAFWFFEYAFSAASVTIVAGTLAERCQMMAYFCYAMFLAGFVYPMVAHSIWSNNGFLSAFSAVPLWGIGCIDFAGSGVVHLTGGTTALVATYILGARDGRFHDDKGEPLASPKAFPGHSVALQLMGTMVLWFGCKYLDQIEMWVRIFLNLFLFLFCLHFQGTASTLDQHCCCLEWKARAKSPPSSQSTRHYQQPRALSAPSLPSSTS
jgi:hypothetical protein